jgi:hypothetical protein
MHSIQLRRVIVQLSPGYSDARVQVNTYLTYRIKTWIQQNEAN